MIGARSGIASCSARLIQPSLHLLHADRLLTLMVRRPSPPRPGVRSIEKGVPSASSDEIHRAKTCSLLAPGKPQKTHVAAVLLTPSRLPAAQTRSRDPHRVRPPLVSW